MAAPVFWILPGKAVRRTYSHSLQQILNSRIKYHFWFKLLHADGSVKESLTGVDVKNVDVYVESIRA